MLIVDRSCVRQPRVDRTVWNTSLSIYAPNNMVQVIQSLTEQKNLEDLCENSELVKNTFFLFLG